MTKAFCFWCENGNSIPKNGYAWIHPDCFQKIMDISNNIRSIREILEGTHARNRFETEKNQGKIDIILDFIKDMEDFERQWQGSKAIMRKMGVASSPEPHNLNTPITLEERRIVK